MKKDVSKISDIEELREIAEWRWKVIERYENYVDRIVPYDHFAWKYERNHNEGKLGVLQIYIADVLGVDVHQDCSMEKAGGYIQSRLEKGIKRFATQYPHFVSNECANALAGRLAKIFLKNDSALKKYYDLRKDKYPDRYIDPKPQSFTNKLKEFFNGNTDNNRSRNG